MINLKKLMISSGIGILMSFLVIGLLIGCGDDKTSGPTGGSSDTTPPTVMSTNPINGSTGVALINVTFSEHMNAASINSTSFIVSSPGVTSIVGTVAYDASQNRASFVPSSPLSLATAFTATIDTTAKDRAGNALTSNYIWHFTTANSTSVQLPITLASSDTYAVLAGASITNTGNSTLTGDLGLSPGTSVTGFPPGIIVGTSHVNDSSSIQAKLNLTTAYNNAAGLTLDPISIAGNIGGMTLPPGLYKSTSSLEISTGNLTLDAKGNSDAIWIFQIASTLTTSSNRNIILSGGALAANVYWQVGTSATLGTASDFKGTILADQSITLNTGALLEGRAFARIGSVTLNGNTITIPTP